MANNSFLPVTTGPAIAGAVEQFANEEISGIHWPAVKVYWGVAGSATPASATDPLPIRIDPAQVGPDIAHGSPDAVAGSSPVKVGGQARDTNPAAVTNGSRTNFIADKLGKQVVVSAIREVKGATYSQIADAAQNIVVPAASGVFRDLYALVFASTSSTTVHITIRDSFGGVTRLFIIVPPGDTRGFTLDCGSAMRQTTSNNDWTVAISGISAGNSVHCTALWVENV